MRAVEATVAGVGEGRMQRLASIKRGRSCVVAKVTVLCDFNMGVGKVGFVGRRSIVRWRMYYYCYYLRNSDKAGHCPSALSWGFLI